MLTNHQVLYISHGGGPLPLLGDPGHQALVAQLQGMRTKLRRPKAIIVISAHWEEPVATITGAAQPPLIYDYNGFPPQSYELSYPALGAPTLANRLQHTLSDAGIDCVVDPKRGYDHGMFVPLTLIYPEADIPVLQLSLLEHLDAEAHLRLGQALAQLAAEELLIIGSGFSFHNMRAFYQTSADADAQANTQNQAFEGWLKETMLSQDISEAERWQRLVNWQQAPSARFCHPREEHLLPLHVCYGVAQRPCDYYDQAVVLGKKAGLFYWS